MQRIKETNTLFLKERNMKYSAKLSKIKRKNLRSIKLEMNKKPSQNIPKSKIKSVNHKGIIKKKYCGGLNEIFLMVSGT